MGPAQYWILVALATLALLALFAFCFNRVRFLRIIEDTPTSRVRSAAQGYVELEGRVEFPRSRPLTSPLRGVPCVWWSFRVEELDPLDEVEPGPLEFVAGFWALVMQLFRARGSGRLVEAGTSHECFLIRDDTAACVVDPEHAQIVGAPTRVWIQGTKRFEESTIPVGHSLYALGLFRTPEGQTDAAERREIGTLVSTWKLDRIKLAERFDRNRNGEVDGMEWDAVWKAATEEVRKARVGEPPAPELHVLCNPGDRRPFVLSALREQKLASRIWFHSIMSLLIFAILVAVLVWSLSVRGLS